VTSPGRAELAPPLLSTYASRIEVEALQGTVEGVRAIVAAHARAIPFETLDPYLGRGVDLTPAAVADKLLLQRRGGWCFEQNLLLGEVLRGLGVPVTDLAARVLWFRPAGVRSPRTHRLLLLELEGRRYLADAGFGILTLTGLLALEADVVQATPHEPHRLTRRGEDWVLEARLGETWQPVYSFDLHPHWPEDFESVNYQLAHDPASPFVSQLRAARVTPEGRLSLRGSDLSLWGSGGLLWQRTVRDVAELLDVLEHRFGIAARTLPGVERGLARCFVPAH
jgi:N-hydroxyarylamine O-acetyltransferase